MKKTLPFLLLIAEALFFFRYALFFRGYVIPWDLRGLHLPYTGLYAEALGRGEFPLWDPYTYCGRPLYATIQAAVFYPTNALAAWLGSVLGREHIFYLLEWSVVLHVAAAGIFTYLLLRSLELRRGSALFGATVYELSGFFAAHAEHLGTVIGAAWLPLAWYAIVRRRWLLLSAAFAMALLGGHTPLAAFVIGFSVWFALLLERSWRLPLRTVAAAGFAVALSAIQLLPTFELTAHSIAKFRLDYLKGGVPPQVFLSLLWPNYYHTFDPPHYNGPADLTFMYLYCGILGLGMAAYGIMLAWRRRLNRVFTILLGTAALAVLGDTTRVTHFLYSLLPDRILIGLHAEMAGAMVVLALAILGALATDQILPERAAWPLAILSAAGLILVSSGRPMNAMPFTPNPAEAEAVARLRALTQTSRPPFRIDFLHETFDLAMSAPLTHLYTASGADIMAPERVIQARLAFCKGERWGSYYEVSNRRSAVLGLMNIGYLLSQQPVAGEEPAVVVPGHYVYENRPVLPRFFLVTRVRQAASMAAAAAMLRAPDFHPSEEAIVEGATSVASAAPPGQVSVARYGLNSLELAVDAPAAQYLVTSETEYPGWRAWVDGQEQPIYYTDVAFRGLIVPAGRHRVTMRFEPAVFRYGAVSSGLAWLAWIALWFWLTARPPRPAESPRSS